jgi:putative ABC transport system permease protein
VSHRSPRLALWLLGRFLPEPERESLIGDLEEARAQLAATSGPGSADRWFWRQTIVALVQLRLARRRRRRPGRRGDSAMQSFLLDVRAALRSLRRSPSHSLVVMGTVALGIGATTAVFSVANPILFKPLPYPEPDRLAMIWERGPDGSDDNLGYATFADLERDARGLASAAAISYWMPVVSGVDGPPERLLGESVSADYFKTLGVTPALGRDFTADEDARGRSRVVILSDGLWRRRFGADSSVVGREISVSGTPYQVVGVLPGAFESIITPGAELWRPLGYDVSLPYACRTCRHLRVVARLRSGTPAASVASELDQLQARYRHDHPKDYASVGLDPVPLSAEVTKQARPAVTLALVAGLFVLLIAAANVANLLVARAVGRRSELSVRSALGAGRWALVRQQLAEGWLLALGGAVGGVGLAAFGIRLLLASEAQLPRIALVRIDGATLALALALTVPVTVLGGLGPALLGAGRRQVGLATRSVTDSRRNRRVTSALVVTEVALAVMLLTGAGLLVRSLGEVLSVDPGFAPDHLVTMEVDASGPRYREDSTLWRVQGQILEAVRTVPGAVAAGFASQIPLNGNFDRYGVRIETKPLANPEDAPAADRYSVSPDYLGTMKIPVLRGRGFTAADRAGAPPVALINRTFAEGSWPGEDPIGQRIQVGGSGWRTVVGIVGDVRHTGLDTRQSPQFYVPSTQWPYAENGALVVRTSDNPAGAAAAVRRAVWSVDPDLALSKLATGDELLGTATRQRRLLMRLFEAFGLTALLLAAAGIYGLLARSVAERTRELGIRVALGAERKRILGLVVGRGARLAGVGLLLGLIGAVSTARVLQRMLFHVTPADPATLAGVTGVLAVVALGTCVLPALRAARVDPVRVLNAE